MKDINEGIEVSVWFGAPTNEWCRGKLTQHHKGKKYANNVVVYYQDEKKGYAFNFGQTNYGKDKLWVIPVKEEEEAEEEEAMEEEEDEVVDGLTTSKHDGRRESVLSEEENDFN